MADIFGSDIHPGTDRGFSLFTRAPKNNVQRSNVGFRAFQSHDVKRNSWFEPHRSNLRRSGDVVGPSAARVQPSATVSGAAAVEGTKVVPPVSHTAITTPSKSEPVLQSVFFRLHDQDGRQGVFHYLQAPTFSLGETIHYLLFTPHGFAVDFITTYLLRGEPAAVRDKITRDPHWLPVSFRRTIDPDPKHEFQWINLTCQDNIKQMTTPDQRYKQFFAPIAGAFHMTSLEAICQVLKNGILAQNKDLNLDTTTIRSITRFINELDTKLAKAITERKRAFAERHQRRIAHGMSLCGTDDNVHVCNQYVMGMIDLVSKWPLHADESKESTWVLESLSKYVRVNAPLEPSEFIEQLRLYVDDDSKSTDKKQPNDFYLSARPTADNGIILIQPLSSRVRSPDQIDESSADLHWRLLIVNARIRRVTMWDPFGTSFRKGDPRFWAALQHAYHGYWIHEERAQIQSENDAHNCGPLIVWAARHYLRWAAEGAPDRGPWLFARNRTSAPPSGVEKKRKVDTTPVVNKTGSQRRKDEQWIPFEFQSDEAFQILSGDVRISDHNKALCQVLRGELAALACKANRENILIWNRRDSGSGSVATSVTSNGVVPMEDVSDDEPSSVHVEVAKPVPAIRRANASVRPLAPKTLSRPTPARTFNSDMLYGDGDGRPVIVTPTVSHDDDDFDLSLPSG